MTHEQYEEFVAMLRHQSLDLIMDIFPYGLDESLHEYQLEISTTYGLQLAVPCEITDYSDTVRIPLPENKTVGDLVAVLFACPLPALILCEMRTGEDDWTTVPGAFDDAILKFLDALEHFDGRAILAWLQGIHEEALNGSETS